MMCNKPKYTDKNKKKSLMFHSSKENADEAVQYRLEQDVRNKDRETKKAQTPHDRYQMIRIPPAKLFCF